MRRIACFDTWRGERGKSRFFTEARATSLIRHPNIVEIFDCDIDASGRAYIIMELLEGETLAALLERQGHLAGDLGSVMEIGIQTTAALAAAHEKGIVHRDLKPENIVLTAARDGNLQIKLVDFGIAKLLGDAGGVGLKQTRTGSVMGTPLYMAPEQARGAGNVDARSDIYSFGCIVFAMLTGGPPFMREGFGDLIVAHVTEPAPDLEGRVPGLPPGLAALVNACLAKDPADRPQDMHVIEHALREIARAVSAARLVVATAPPRAPSASDTVSVSTPQVGGTRLLPGTAIGVRTHTTLESGNGQVGQAAHVPASGVGRWMKIAAQAGVVVLAVAVAVLGLSPSGRDAEGGRAPAATPAPARPAAPPPAPWQPEERVSADGGTSDQGLAAGTQAVPAAREETAPTLRDRPREKRARGSKQRPGDFRGFSDL